MDQTPGSQSDLGMEYQYKVTTFIAALLSQNKNVEDFVIHTNLKDAGKFDDIIARVKFKTKDQSYLYLIQVKHTSKANGVKLNDLKAYADSFHEIMKTQNFKFREGISNETIHFWFFCNNIVIEPIQFHKSKLYLQKRSQSLGADESIITFNDCCYKLNSPGEDAFFDKLYFFLKQPNISEIVNSIGKICDIHDTMVIIRYVQEYSKVPDLHVNGLSKRVFEVELLRIHLSEYILTPTLKIDMNNDQSCIWNKIILDHDVTIIKDEKDVEQIVFGCLSHQIDQILNHTIQWNNCVKNGGNLNEHIINEFVKISKLSQTRHWILIPNILKSLLVELWVLGELPLVLKTNSELSVLKRYQHLKKKVIIIDDLKKRYEEVHSFGLNTLIHVGNINSIELRNELLKRILISLQGRKPTSLHSVISEEKKLMQSLSCSLILHLMKRRKEYLKEECFDETNSLIFLIENEYSDESVRIDDINVNDDTNIKLYCKHSEVEAYSHQIKQEPKFKSHSLCYLQALEDRLVLIDGDKDKLRNFFVDENGDEIYSIDDGEAVLVIGCRLGDNETFYMSRNLNRATLEIPSIDKFEKAMYFLSGEIDTLNSVIANQIIKGPVDHIAYCAKIGLENDRSVFVNVDDRSIEDLWEKFSSDGYSLLHLIIKNGQMQIAKCRNCRSLSSSISYKGDTFGEECFFTEIMNGISLLSATPGAGKSTLLSSLSKKYKEENYVLFCNLIDYRRDLRERKSGLNEAPLNFIFSKINKTSRSTKYVEFLTSLCEFHRRSGRLILFIDSFDEVITVCKTEALEFIRNIAKNANIKIIIASRFITDNLIVNDFEIQPFEISDLEEGGVKECIRKGTSIEVHDLPIPTEFLKTPLYLSFLMILKIEGIENIVEIHKLHDRIVEKKIERYFRKKNDYYNSSKYQREDVLKVHKCLALAAIFGKEVISDQLGLDYEDLVNECIETDKIKLGLISRFSNDYPVFIHQTFVEFLMIDWFCTNIKHPFSKSVYEYILTKCDWSLKNYFNKIMCKGLQLHNAILDNNIPSVVALCSTSDYHLRQMDKCNRLPLHLAAYIGHKTTVDNVLQYMIKYQFDVNAPDIFMGWTWIEYLENLNERYFEDACASGLTTSVEIYLNTKQRLITDEDVSNALTTKNLETALLLLKKNESLLRKYFKRMMLRAINLGSLDMVYDINRILYCENKKFRIIHEACQNLSPISLDCINCVTRTGLTALHLASICGNPDVVKDLLDAGVISNTVDDFERTPLHYSVIQGSIAVASLLVQHMPNLNAKDKDGNTSLHLSIEFSNVKMADLLLKNNVFVDARNNDYLTPLHIAASKDCTALVKNLLEHGAEVNCKTLKDVTALHIASQHCIKNNIEILLKYGSNVNHINSTTGESLLQQNSYNADVVKMLLDGGADINHIDNDGGNVLHTALRGFGENAIKVLLENGADINLVDYNCISVLELAITRSYASIKEMLLEKGAILNAEGIYAISAVRKLSEESNQLRDIIDKFPQIKLIDEDKFKLLQCNMRILYKNIKSSNIDDARCVFSDSLNVNRIGEAGLTLLHFAVKNNDLDAAKRLLEIGANINRRAIGGATALHFAVENVNFNMIYMLLSNGANVNMADEDGINALLTAVVTGDLDITKAILENGGSIDSRDIYGSTALHVAIRRNNAILVKILLEKGASANAYDVCNITPLHLAVKCNNIEIERLLMEYGAKVKDKNKHFKWSNLHRAVECDQIAIIKTSLEQVVVDIDEKDYRGKTLLHMAVENNSIVAADMLLRRGADINLKDIRCQCETALDKAVKRNNTNMVKLLLQWGPDVDLRDERGQGLLFKAVNNNNINIAKLLLESKVYVNPTHDYDVNSLHCAYLRRNIEMVTLLRANGAYMTDEEYHKTALCEAVERNDRDHMEELISNGADVNARDERGSTLLHIAVKNNNKNILKILLSNDAYVNVKSATGLTLLHSAIKRNNVDVVKILLEYNADVNRQSKYVWPALHFATIENRVDIVEVLLQKHTDINRKFEYGSTALHLATRNNNIHIFKLLIENGADVNRQSDSGLTAIHIASRNNNVDIINILLEKGADTTLITDDGSTALHLAVTHNNANAIRILLENEANYNRQDNNGSTIVHIAARNANVVLLKLLLDKKVDLCIRNNDGLTPLHVAVQENNLEMVKTLLHHRADVNIKDINGNTALHLRAMEYDIMKVEESMVDEIIDALLRHGANSLMLNDNQKSPVDIVQNFGLNALPTV